MNPIGGEQPPGGGKWGKQIALEGGEPARGWRWGTQLEMWVGGTHLVLTCGEAPRSGGVGWEVEEPTQK